MARTAPIVVVMLLTACTPSADDPEPAARSTAVTSPAPTTGRATTSTSAPTSTTSTSTTTTVPATSTPTSSSTTTSSTTTSSTTTSSTSTTSTSTTSTTASSTTTTTVRLPPTPTPSVPPPIRAPDVAGNRQPRTGRTWIDRPPSDIPAPSLPDDWTVEVIGTSVLGRDISAWRRPVTEPRRVVLVVGGIHGNEPVSPPTVRSLVEIALPDDLELWLVPELNVDGVAVGSRANARGVDLNRNFPWRWDAYDGGPAPLSEPEPQAIATLIETIRPGLVVWVHQPLGYVSSIGGTPDAFEQAWSRGAGVRVRPDVTQHGGGESWTAFVAGLASMLVEVDTYEATPEMVAAHQNGFRELLAALG